VADVGGTIGGIEHRPYGSQGLVGALLPAGGWEDGGVVVEDALR
jgi:hypothetical protein